MTRTGKTMRRHVVCKNERNADGSFKRLPPDYNWMNSDRETHVYDVGDEELNKLYRLFDEVEIIE